MAQPHHAAAAAAAMAADPLLKRAVWDACAGPFALLPSIGTKVYYLPRGHADHCHVDDLSHVPADDAVPCTVTKLVLGFRAGTDEPYALISLQRGDDLGPPLAQPPEAEDTPAERMVYYVRHLTSFRGERSPFTIPKPCAVSLFPLLVQGQNPSQEVHMVDVHGNPLSFNYGLTNKGVHRLAGNWNKYCDGKNLQTGKGKDSVVFMRCGEGEAGGLVISSRRGAPSNDLAVELVPNVEAGSAAAEAEPGTLLWVVLVDFTITYYPRQGWPFVVPRQDVDKALEVDWRQGLRVRMAVPVDAHELPSSRQAGTRDFFEGTVTNVNGNGTLWCKLQVDWDGSSDLDSKVSTPNSSVNAWQVKAVETSSRKRRASDASSSSTTGSDAPSSSATGSVKLIHGAIA